MGFLSTLFGVDDEQAHGEQLDAQLAEMNSRDYAKGGHVYNNIEQIYGTEAADRAYEVTQKDLQNTKTGDVESQLDDAFVEGAKEGLSNEKSFVNGTVTGFLSAIPWSVWLIGAIAIFAYIGGFAMLAKKGKGILNHAK